MEQNTTMSEHFSLHAQHSGAINHIHTFQFSDSAAGIAREIRLGLTAVVVGWVAVVAIRGFLGARITRRD